MSIHTAHIDWERRGSVFTDNRYSREHTWRFDGGLVVPASSSPQVVRTPWSNPANVDPEEAYVAALSSCHMLWFLGLAAGRGFVVDRYGDAAQASMERNAGGKQWLARLTLHPQVVFCGAQAPGEADVAALHHDAHGECFLANSVRTEIAIEGRWEYRP